jgi:hypothetical protein
MDALQNADCSGLHQRIFRAPSVRSNRLSVERPTRCPSYPAVVSMESVLRHWPGRGGGDLLQLNAGNRRSFADRRSCFGNDSTMRSCPNAERWLRALACSCTYPPQSPQEVTFLCSASSLVLRPQQGLILDQIAYVCGGL